jgi:ATP-dependent HslUV protease, peptidase subunit HslV
MINKIIYNFCKPKWRNTTILAVKKNNEIFLIGDGQVSYGSTRVKTNANKIRELPNGVFCGFAGSVADAFYLFDGLETQLKKYPNQTLRACVEYAKDWRTGK